MFRTLKHWLVGGDGAMVMPARVAGQIEREQEDSEILIGWMQFAGVTFFAVVFGAVGDDSRLEYTVIGDAVNLAAKLECHTKVEPARGLTTSPALAVARRQGYAAVAEPDVRAARRCRSAR